MPDQRQRGRLQCPELPRLRRDAYFGTRAPKQGATVPSESAAASTDSDCRQAIGTLKLFDLDEVLDLEDHTAHALVVDDFVRLADAAETEGLQGLLLVVLAADCAFHLRHTQHFLVCHYSASSTLAACGLRPQM